MTGVIRVLEEAIGNPYEQGLLSQSQDIYIYSCVNNARLAEYDHLFHGLAVCASDIYPKGVQRTGVATFVQPQKCALCELF